MSEGEPVIDDPRASTVIDDDPTEQRFVSLGMGAKGRLLVIVYSYVGGDIRLISVRLAEPPPAGKRSITIRLDEDVLDKFLEQADETGRGYQTLINEALREHFEPKAPAGEQFRLIIREELVRHVKT